MPHTSAACNQAHGHNLQAAHEVHCQAWSRERVRSDVVAPRRLTLESHVGRSQIGVVVGVWCVFRGSVVGGMTDLDDVRDSGMFRSTTLEFESS